MSVNPTTREKKDQKDESEMAFDIAIKSGRLSDDPLEDNYAGSYMYMGFYAGKYNFKNITTREYDV